MSSEEVKSKSMADTYYPSSSAHSEGSGGGGGSGSGSGAAASASSSASSSSVSSSSSSFPNGVSSASMSAPISGAELTSLSESENLWSYLLKKASRRIRDSNNQATIVLLGDPHQGKSTLLSRLSDRVYVSSVSSSTESSSSSSASAPTAANPSAAAPPVANIGHYVYDYSFLLAKNKFSADKEEILAHVNVWTIENINHIQLLQQALKANGATTQTNGQTASAPSSISSSSSSSATAPASSSPTAGFDIRSLESTLFVVCVDLSEPWKVEKAVRRWLNALSSTLQSLYSQFPKSESERLKTQIRRLIQSYYLNPLPTDWNEFPLKSDIPKENLGVPIVIVGTKGDLFSRYLGGGKAADTEEKFEFLTRRLRRIAVEYGAALLFASALGSKGVNVELLQQYFYHRLLGFPLQPTNAPAAASANTANSSSTDSSNSVASAPSASTQPKAIASTDGEDFRLFIPHGFDSFDLIDSSLPLSTRVGWKDDTPLEEVFKSAEKLAMKKFAPLIASASAGSTASTASAGSSSAAAGGGAAAASAPTAAVGTDGIVKALDNAAFFNNLKAQLQTAQSLAGAATSSAASALFNNLPSKTRAPAAAATTAAAPADSGKKPAEGKPAAPAPIATGSGSKSNATSAGGAPKSPKAAAAVAAAAASTANANLNPKGQIAVKQFFRSLLNNNPPRPADAAANTSAARNPSHDKSDSTQ